MLGLPIMAKRLSVKHKKRRLDQRRAYQAGEAPALHKVGEGRSRKALLKKAYKMC